MGDEQASQTVCNKNGRFLAGVNRCFHGLAPVNEVGPFPVSRLESGEGRIIGFPIALPVRFPGAPNTRKRYK